LEKNSKSTIQFSPNTGGFHPKYRFFVPAYNLYQQQILIANTMRNSLLVTSDLNAVILVDTLMDDKRLAIGKRGVLLSVLGTEVCASEVGTNLEAFVNTAIGTQKAFYEFDAADLAKNQLCITYNDLNSTVFIIGITDIIANLAGPTEIAQSKVKTFAVKMKNAPGTGLASPNVVLVRLETAGLKKWIRFYHLSTANT
jgi:hypothetical protein